MDAPVGFAHDSSSLLSEEQFLCSVCLDVFTDPVTTPCGHNFCNACLTEYWDKSQRSHCPLCKELFTKRPELKINIAFREVVERVKRKSSLDKTELLEVMEEKQKAAEKEAEGLIKELEQELTELTRRDTELERLSHSKDHLHLLQIYPSLCTPLHTNNWTDISMATHLSVETVRKALSEIQKTLDEKLCELEPKRIQQYAVDVTLDPDTAHPELILSDDGKQVSCGDIKQNLPDNPERFDYCHSVLGKEAFSSGKFYYEVKVKEKTKWALGVVRQSIIRKGPIILSPENGFWTVIRNENEYVACADTSFSVPPREEIQKVGVFVDYEEGLVSFYDVEARSHIYTFSGQSFSEKLHPYFYSSLNDRVPLIISPTSK